MTELVLVAELGCLAMAKVPKKNNLSLMIAPPKLPPNSFRINGFFVAGLPGLIEVRESFSQVLAFKAALRKSS